MIVGRVQDLTEAHIKALVANLSAESPTLDFKRDVPGRDAPARHDYCSDLCAFANAAGGDLIYGIDEDGEGRASVVVAQTVNPDDEQLRLLDMALNGLEPRVSGLEARAIPVAGGHVFIVRVPKTWNGPHRVRTNQHFYVREGVRKRQLDMPEIRNSFVRAAGQTEELERFRAHRVAKILTTQPPMEKLVPGPIAVFHIVPLAPTVDRAAVDPRAFYVERRLPTIGGGGGYSRINLDGAMRTESEGKGITKYTQIFRDGRVEAAMVFTSHLDTKNPYIPSTAFENWLIGFYGPMMNELAHFKIDPPFALLLSLLGVHGVRFANRGEQESGDGPSLFDRNEVLLPDVVVEEATGAEVALRPVFDLLWQCVGYPGSLNYDKNGKRETR